MNELTAEVLATQQRAAALGQAHAELLASRLGVGGSDLRALFLVLERPRMARELATELRLTPSAVTSVVDRLERAGLARRERSATDRRQVLVHAVPEAAARAVSLYAPLHERMVELVERFDAGQLEVLREFVEGTERILRERLAEL